MHIYSAQIRGVSLELHDFAMDSIAEQILDHPFPLFLRKQVLSLGGFFITVVLLAEIVHIQRVKFSKQFLVDVGVVAICISQEN